MADDEQRSSEEQQVDDEMTEMEPIEVPIDGVLDLHTFAPGDLKELVPEYLRVCQERGILDIRIIHGKGIGHLRRSVHALLERSGRVAGFRLAGEGGGGWGATIVRLKESRKR